MKEPRRIVAEIIVDDAIADELGMGTLDYLDYLIKGLAGKIEIPNARVIDWNDTADKEFIKAMRKIF